MNLIYCGSKETMEKVARRGVYALNPKTMKWQTVNKKASYTVVDTNGTLAELHSDIDLKKEAEEKGLIL